MVYNMDGGLIDNKVSAIYLWYFSHIVNSFDNILVLANIYAVTHRSYIMFHYDGPMSYCRASGASNSDHDLTLGLKIT